MDALRWRLVWAPPWPPFFQDLKGGHPLVSMPLLCVSGIDGAVVDELELTRKVKAIVATASVRKTDDGVVMFDVRAEADAETLVALLHEAATDAEGKTPILEIRWGIGDDEWSPDVVALSQFDFGENQWKYKGDVVVTVVKGQVYFSAAPTLTGRQGEQQRNGGTSKHAAMNGSQVLRAGMCLQSPRDTVEFTDRGGDGDDPDRYALQFASEAAMLKFKQRFDQAVNVLDDGGVIKREVAPRSVVASKASVETKKCSTAPLSADGSDHSWTFEQHVEQLQRLHRQVQVELGKATNASQRRSDEATAELVRLKDDMRKLREEKAALQQQCDKSRAECDEERKRRVESDRRVETAMSQFAKLERERDAAVEERDRATQQRLALISERNAARLKADQTDGALRAADQTLARMTAEFIQLVPNYTEDRTETRCNGHNHFDDCDCGFGSRTVRVTTSVPCRTLDDVKTALRRRHGRFRQIILGAHHVRCPDEGVRGVSRLIHRRSHPLVYEALTGGPPQSSVRTR